jgi:hypothetical protein
MVTQLAREAGAYVTREQGDEAVNGTRGPLPIKKVG